jgi:hypothetical protein
MKVTVAYFIIILYFFLSPIRSLSWFTERFLFSANNSLPLPFSLPRRFFHHRFLITQIFFPSSLFPNRTLFRSISQNSLFFFFFPLLLSLPLSLLRRFSNLSISSWSTTTSTSLEHHDDDELQLLEHDELQLDLAIPTPTVPSLAQILPAQDGWVITHCQKRQRKRKEERDVEAGGLQKRSGHRCQKAHTHQEICKDFV